MKRIKLFEEFTNGLNESIQTSDNWLFTYMKSIQKRLKSKGFDVTNLGDKTYVDFDDKLRLVLKDSKVVAYNTDMSDDFFELPRSMKSFKDIEKNIKLLYSSKNSKPLRSINISKGADIGVDIVDLDQYGIKELKGGLTFEMLQSQYSWILDAKIKDAVIGIGKDYMNIITWHSGTWMDGTWKNGIWKDGTWEDGIWEDGTWKGGTWENGIWRYGTWESGIWKDGIWQYGEWKRGNWENGLFDGGTWYDGIWKDGKWRGAVWENGTWKGGTWENGEWEESCWKDGTWEDGIWQDGIWQDGTFEDGVWYDGTFKGGTWKGGTWKGGTWEGGTWKDGEGKPENA